MEKDTRRSRSGKKPGRGFCFAAGTGEAGGKASGVCTGGAMTGECCDPEGYWRGEVRHPSAACGGTSPCRGGLGGLRRGEEGGRWLADAPAQGRFGAVRRGVVTQGRCGGRERPPYIVAGNGQRRVSGSLPRGLAAGRCKASGPAQICGRGACAASREGIGGARCGTPPPPAAAPPLAGEALEVCGGGEEAAAGCRIPLRRYVREGLPGFALCITGRFWGREAAGMGKFGIC